MYDVHTCDESSKCLVVFFLSLVSKQEKKKVVEMIKATA